MEHNDKITSDSCPRDCSVCGQEHDTASCRFILELKYVKDEPVLSRARQTLPKNLEITRMADGTTTVVAKCNFQQGTTFGPLRGKREPTMNPMNHFPITVFGDSPRETYHLDLSSEESSNWMSFVSPASNYLEQNLVCYQTDENVYYTAMRFISSGEQLRVWYAPRYALKMNMPLFNTEFASIDDNSETNNPGTICDESGTEKNQSDLLDNKNLQEIAQRLPAEHLGARGDKTSWNCALCSIVISSVIEYAKHLMKHYKPLSGVFCDICNKKYHRLSVLQKHKRLEHPDETSNNEVVGIPTSKNLRRQNAQTILMNMTASDAQSSETMKDVLEKLRTDKVVEEKNDSSDPPLIDTRSMSVNDLLRNNETICDDSSLKTILDNQCLSMNLGLGTITESILSDNTSRAVNAVKFNAEELSSDLLGITPEVEDTDRTSIRFHCDICEKKFDKADYLYRHLRKHTGEFICKNCLGVFARKENLISHLCPWRKIDNRKYECLYCQKLFVTKKYLKRHVLRHTETNICKWCRSSFASSSELLAHECRAPQNLCSQCGKRFVHREHLNRHAKIHADPKPTAKRTKKKVSTEKFVICEKCGDVFKNHHSLKQHLRSHGERTFECEVCHSKFHRIGVLQQHKSVHQSIQIPCEICGKKLKSKKALSVHVLLHGNRKFHCDKCDKSFFQRCNYLKHYRQLHSEKILQNCPHCQTRFTSELHLNKHLESHVKPTQHPCNSCHKVFHREYQLKRHVQTNHSGIVFRCPYCKMTARYRHSMRRHFERQHKSFSDEWKKPDFVNKLIEKASSSLMIEKIASMDNHSKIDEIPYGNLSTVGLKADNNSQNLISSMVDDEQFDERAEKSVEEIVSGDFGPSSLNEREIFLRVSEINESESMMSSDELNSTEIPQLSISDADANLSDSVLGGSAFVFGDDGNDIMFYVLDNAPIITEY